MLPTIALVNRTSKKTPEEIARCARSIDWQVRADLAPAWGFYASVFYAPKEELLPDSTWRVYLYDEPADLTGAGRLGYHRFDGATPTPVGHVFVGPSERADEPWSAITSHEVIEMLGDPWVNLEVRRGAELWPRELCDAVQGEYYRTPLVDGLEVADFVRPEYFIEGATGPFDHLGRLSAPFSLAPAGYSLVRQADVLRAVYGEGYASWRREQRPASRRAERYGASQ